MLIHPDHVGAFLLHHTQNEIVFHNVKFDFWVIHHHLQNREEQDALHVWLDLARKRCLRDTMLLDMLLSIARGGTDVRPRDLGIVAEEQAGLGIDKDDPYRKRYLELIGADWSEVDLGFFEYAIKDAIATVRAYNSMHTTAKQIMDDMGFDPQIRQSSHIRPDAIPRFGVMTEAIQVQGAIALDAISRAGLYTDRERQLQLKRKYDQQLTQEIEQLQEMAPDLFQRDPQGQLKRTAKTQATSKSTAALERHLLQAIHDIEQSTGQRVDVPRSPKGGISRRLEHWKTLIPQHPFLKLWVDFENTVKLRQFITNFDAPMIHPQYIALKRTGRTACSKPNIQQTPQDDDFRELVVPSPNHLFLIVDYKFIELVHLAAVCLRRFGKSRLAEVIRDGIDPHCYTAALLKEMSYPEFMRLKQTQAADFKRWRQMAKPVNFGVPGGMGAESLRENARTSFAVEMSLEEAQRFHRQLTHVYPELKTYLRATQMEALAQNLKTSPQELWDRLDRDGTRSPAVPGGVRKVVSGQTWKADGTPYSGRYVQRVWDVLNAVNQNPEFTTPLTNRLSSPKLADQLFFASVATLTGRIRGGVSYTTERNTQFQGLASDGAKLALGRLVLAGYRVVGFIHDELLIELPDEGGWVSKARVEEVVREIVSGMEEVTEGIPVHEFLQLLVGMNVELAKPLKELDHVGHCGIAEHLRFAAI